MGSCGKESPNCRLCFLFDEGIFSDLSDNDLELLNRSKTTNQYKKKQIIFYEGHPIVGLYVIRTGRVKLFKTTPDGKQQILKIAREGEVLGYSSLFTDTPHNATAEAVADSDICFLDKARFLAIIHDNVSVALKLLVQLSRELNRSEEKTMDLAYKSVRVRFVEFLLTLNKNFGIYENSVYRLNIALTREEMAQAIGTTVETVVRLLSEFRSEGLVDVEKKNISILELDKLLAFTETGY